jgi:hypothetical protein
MLAAATRRMSLSLFIALYLLEAGVFFTIVPWTRIWTLNPLLHHHVELAAFADNPFVRGFVSGVGVIHIMIGVRDIMAMRRNSREEPPA